MSWLEKVMGRSFERRILPLLWEEIGQLRLPTHAKVAIEKRCRLKPVTVEVLSQIVEDAVRGEMYSLIRRCLGKENS